jgi:carboxymethylenebutenolidase
MILVDGETADVPTRLGPMRTHLLRPAATGRYPGVVLFSEIFQVTAPIRRTAAMLAGHGFVVAVPEVYHELEAPGTVLPYTPEGTARGNAHKIAKTLESYDADARACVELLRALPHCNGRVGALGMCLGGHLALRAALQPEILAAACLYPTDLHTRSLGRGQADDTLARCGEIRGELLMIFGRQDPHVPPEGRVVIQQALCSADVRFTWLELNAAHAFLRDEGPRYDPALALLCYPHVIELFRRKLGEGDQRA